MPNGDNFFVNHPVLADVNDGLQAEINKMDSIMDDLNATLSGIDQASQGKATPLWHDQQNTWNSSYEEMRGLLSAHTAKSIRVGQTFQEGDYRGAKLMAT
jgi:uncharacterized protein YukE